MLDLLPSSSAKSACNAARIGEHCPNLRRMHGVTHTPTIRPDGSILDEPGYEAETRLIYMPEPGLDIPPIPDNPTDKDIRDAFSLPIKPLQEFPFVSQTTRPPGSGWRSPPYCGHCYPGHTRWGSSRLPTQAQGRRCWRTC
jgi:hypothetical protein